MYTPSLYIHTTDTSSILDHIQFPSLLVKSFLANFLSTYQHISMSNYNQNQAYPPPATSYPAEPQGGYMAPPPPAGYPMRDGQPEPAPAGAAATQSRGDGFWKGCCAALCCCCVLDACF